jgi:hypothetical protein
MEYYFVLIVLKEKYDIMSAREPTSLLDWRTMNVDHKLCL